VVIFDAIFGKNEWELKTMQDIGQQESRPQTTSGYTGAERYGRPQAGAAEAALDLFKEYARERPEIVTMWAFGLGFVLGWKLRIW
jgi:hypothetical protein